MTDDATVTATAPAGGSVTATAAQPSAQVKVVEHGDASTLPDSSGWMWRRLLIYLVTVAALAFTGWIIERIDDVTTLRMIARYCLGLVALCLFLYVAGASAEDVVRLVSAVRTTRKETITNTPPEVAPAVVAAVVGETAPSPASDKPPWERGR